MFGAELVGAFGELKAIFDPGHRMNPGKVVHPAALDEHLRLGANWAPATPQDLLLQVSRMMAGRSRRPPTGVSASGNAASTPIRTGR